jgi:hypothetical protein
MLGRELRVPVPHRDGLRRLQETLGALRVFFDVHVPTPLSAPAALA